jgi:hypothetical protein
VDLDAAADQLYVTPPSDFVRLRNELAAEAQRAGDKATAATIKKLRKPTLGAWLANLLVHGHPDQTDELLRLGELLRRAQLNLAGAELRRLVQQRREVIGTLVGEAREMARKAGQPVAEDAARELETTLSAALADEAASELLRSGRLTAALEHSGFGPLELAGDWAPLQADRRPSKQARATSGTPTASDVRLRQRRAAAEKVLRDAQQAASDATQALAAYEEKLDQFQRAHDERGREVSELEQRLVDAKTAATTSERDVRSAERARRDAERRLREARDHVNSAEEALAALARQ